MPRFLTATEAVDLIPSAAHVTVIGFTLMGAPEAVTSEIERRFLAEGRPRDLTLLHGAGQSNGVVGIEHFAHAGLIRRVIGSHWGLAPRMRTLIAQDGVEAYALPQGQLCNLYAATAAGRPGILTTVGLHTFVDPRLEGGKVNARTQGQEDLVELVSVGGQEYLLYRAIAVDVCILRATVADEDGNLAMDEEAVKLEWIHGAMAAKRSGGTVIAQVKYVTRRGTLHPKRVVVPGILVDAVVVATQPEQEHRQTSGAFFHPAYAGDIRVPAGQPDPLPGNERTLIGQRAYREIPPGALVNLGTGIPADTIGPLARMNGEPPFRLSVESGMIGGIPGGGFDFGVAVNQDAMIDHTAIFDYYNGTGVDVTLMGAAEVDAAGNVNSSRFGDRIAGCGGFIDITQAARKVVFCLSFMAGHPRFRIEGDRLTVLEDSDQIKFVERVGQVTFSGPYAMERGQEVVYVTERAVFRLTPRGIMLEEVRSGVRLHEDVLAKMAFVPQVARDLPS